MRFLRQNTAVRITVGPFFDKTDGVTPETALTVTNDKLTLMVDDDDGTAANLILDAAATASGGDNDMVHVTNDDAGFYDLELTAAQTNYLGRAVLSITDTANHCPVFHEFMIVSQGVYDKLFGAYSTTRGLAGTALPDAAADAAGGLPISDAGGLDLDAKVGALTFTVANKVDANSVAISGDSTAADNLETMLDGTGGQTLSLGKLAVVANDAAGAVVISNAHASGYGVSVGATGPGVYITGATTAAISVVGGIMTNTPAIKLEGAGSGAGLEVNTVSVTGTTTLTGAVSLGSTLGITGAVTLSSTLTTGAATFASMTCTGALTVSDGVIVTCSTTNRDGMSVTGNGTGHGIYATSGSGASGNGIQARSVATTGQGISGLGSTTGSGIVGTSGGGIGSRGISGIATGESSAGIGGTGAGAGISAAGSTAGIGFSATGAGGSDGMKVTGPLEVTGATTLTGAVSLGSTLGIAGAVTLSSTLGVGAVTFSSMAVTGGITANITGNLSGSVGSVTGAVGSVTGAVGSVTGAVGSVTGAVGSVTGNVGGNVVGSVASVTGAVGSVTGNVGGSVASVTGAVGSVTGNVGGNVTGSVGSVAGAVASVTGTVGGIAGTTQTLDALQTAQNSAHGSGSWATATGFATPTNITSATGIQLAASQHVIVDSGTVTTLTGHTPQTGDAYADTQILRRSLIVNTTTIATLASQTSFTLTAGSTDNDAYNGCLIVVRDASTAEQRCVGFITDYTGSSKTVTLAISPGVFTMAAGDLVDIIPCDAKAVWDEVLTGDTHNIATSAGRRVRNMASLALTDGTLAVGGAAGTSTCTLNGNAVATARIYEQNLLVITGGAGAGQTRMIVEYTAGRVATIERPWDVTTDATSEYQIQANSGLIISQNGMAQAGAADSITLATSASATENVYRYSMVHIGAGTGAGQTRLITAYSTGRVATVSPNWTTTPDNTSAYKILPVGLAVVESLTTAALAAINAEADTALTDYGANKTAPDNTNITNIHNIVKSGGTGDAAAIKVVTDKLGTTVVQDGAVYDFTAAALAAGPTGGTAPTVEQIRAEMDSNSTQLAAIVADTNELEVDWKNGGRLDTLLDTAATQATTANATLDNATYGLNALHTDIASITPTSVPTAAQIRAEMDSNSTQLAAIVADTNELEVDWKNGGRLDTILDTAASASLTAQQVRDAMKLAPSAGAAAAGSVDTHLDTIQADAATAAGAGSAGSGSFAVNHDSGGTDALAVKPGGVGTANFDISAYLTSDYSAGNQAVAYRKGYATSNDSGRWINSMMLNAGSYTIRYEKDGYDVTTETITIAADGTVTVT